MQPGQGSQPACFTPAEINLKRHLKSLDIARFLLPKPNHIAKPTGTKPHIIETDRLALRESLGYASYTLAMPVTLPFILLVNFGLGLLIGTSPAR